MNEEEKEALEVVLNEFEPYAEKQKLNVWNRMELPKELQEDWKMEDLVWICGESSGDRDHYSKKEGKYLCLHSGDTMPYFYGWTKSQKEAFHEAQYWQDCLLKIHALRVYLDPSKL